MQHSTKKANGMKISNSVRTSAATTARAKSATIRLDKECKVEEILNDTQTLLTVVADLNQTRIDKGRTLCPTAMQIAALVYVLKERLETAQDLFSEL